LELAQRLRADPGTEGYGALSVLVQALADVELVRTLPPSVFWPRPKVDSALVVITPSPAKRSMIPDLTWFHTVVRQVFQLRRKTLRRVLRSLWNDQITRSEVDPLLESVGLTGLVRAEALNVEEFLALSSKLRERLEPVPKPK